MAEPGDPTTPDHPRPTPQPEVDHDDLVGFSSPRSLEGRPRVVAEPEPVAPALPPLPVATPLEPEPIAAPLEPVAPVVVAPEPVVAPPPRPRPIEPEPQPQPQPAPTPSWARETVRNDPPPSAAIQNASSLFSVYALILFAVPTLGVSALIALVAVTGRPGPQGEAAMSHFIYQQRTLWAGAVAALLGAILIAVGLGVFVLFALAIWLILRGASGVYALKAGRAIRNPRGWLI